MLLFTRHKPRYHTIRLYKSIEDAREDYSKQVCLRHAYTSPTEVVRRHAQHVLQNFLVSISRQFTDTHEQYKSSLVFQDPTIKLPRYFELGLPKDNEVLGQKLWQLCHLVGDPVQKLPHTIGGSDKFFIRLELLNDHTLWENFPRQAKVLVEMLITLGKETPSELELHNRVINLHLTGKLKTKQDPVLIWQYYAPMFGDKGLIDYPGRRRHDSLDTDM